MARSLLTWARVAIVVAFAAQTAAQKCYYPSGAESDAEFACSTAPGSACCPLNWQCLDNGSCYYPATNLTGRYSCTDQSWDSPGCPSNLCTYNMAATGGESLKSCSNHGGEWCCNGDDSVVKCCDGQPQERPFFNLQKGNVYAIIGSSTASTAPILSTITAYALSDEIPATGVSVGTTSRSPSAASSAASSAPSTPASSQATTTSSMKPVTSLKTSVSSGSQGIQTAVITVIVTPSATAEPARSNDGDSKTNIGLIVGLAVGIPLAIALLGILIWMLRKRRNQKATNPYSDVGGDEAALTGAAATKKKNTYNHTHPNTAEIDSMPVGPGRPISTLKGRAELATGDAFQPGTGASYGPDTVGMGGGNADRATWGSSPPGYSPGMNQAAFHHPGTVELDSTPVLPIINEKSEHTSYQPPPDGVVEMPTVVTPPAEVEKRV